MLAIIRPARSTEIALIAIVAAVVLVLPAPVSADFEVPDVGPGGCVDQCGSPGGPGGPGGGDQGEDSHEAPEDVEMRDAPSGVDPTGAARNSPVLKMIPWLSRDWSNEGGFDEERVRELVETVRTLELSPFETRAFELRPFELRPFEPRPFELRPFELRAFDLRPFELRPFELTPFELRAFEMRDPFPLGPLTFSEKQREKLEQQLAKVNNARVRDRLAEGPRPEMKPFEMTPFEMKVQPFEMTLFEMTPFEMTPFEMTPTEMTPFEMENRIGTGPGGRMTLSESQKAMVEKAKEAASRKEAKKAAGPKEEVKKDPLTHSAVKAPWELDVPKDELTHSKIPSPTELGAAGRQGSPSKGLKTVDVPLPGDRPDPETVDWFNNATGEDLAIHALEVGKGDLAASIVYLKNRMRTQDPYAEKGYWALSYVKGLYDAGVKSGKIKKTLFDPTVDDPFDLFEEGRKLSQRRRGVMKANQHLGNLALIDALEQTNRDFEAAIRYLEARAAEGSDPRRPYGPRDARTAISYLHGYLQGNLEFNQTPDAETAARDSKAPAVAVPPSAPTRTSPPWDDVTHALTAKSLVSTLRGDHAKAVEYLREAHERVPGDQVILDALRHAEGYYQGQSPDAPWVDAKVLEHIRAEYERNPNDPIARGKFNRADGIHQAQQERASVADALVVKSILSSNPAKAVEYLREAHERVPGDQGILDALRHAEGYYRGQSPNAPWLDAKVLEHMRAEHERNPADAKARETFNWAHGIYLAQRERMAIADALVVKSIGSTMRGDHAKAVEQMREAHKRVPGDQGILDALRGAEGYYHGQSPDAPWVDAKVLEHMRAEYERNPADAKAREKFNRAEGIHQAQQQTVAIGDALAVRGIQSGMRGDHRKAVEYFREAHERVPRDQGIFDVLRHAEGYLQGQNPDAPRVDSRLLEHFRTQYERNPADTGARGNYNYTVGIYQAQQNTQQQGAAIADR